MEAGIFTRLNRGRGSTINIIDFKATRLMMIQSARLQSYNAARRMFRIITFLLLSFMMIVTTVYCGGSTSVSRCDLHPLGVSGVDDYPCISLAMNLSFHLVPSRVTIALEILTQK